jgi:LytS/YehU family sensor histidine kinase
MGLFDKTKLNDNNVMSIFIFIFLYVIIGQFNSYVKNPMVPGAIVAVNMIIIVIAGILYGKEVGLITGLMGTSINAVVMGNVTPTNFEYASIIPHLIMGWTAGKLKEKNGLLMSSFAIIVGHALNIITYLIAGLMKTTDVNSIFFKGMAYEAIFGIISIVIISWLYIKIFREKPEKDSKKR